MKAVEENIETVTAWIDFVIEYLIQYGFQILGALAFLVVGLIAAGWIGNRISNICMARGIDETLSKFIGSGVKLLLIGILIIITLGNFGISIAPLIALAGALAFGATMAMQGPLSNFGAGLAIILSRPYVIGNMISVHGISGVVENITLGITFLKGEDGETISVPNKEIVGRVIVNSHKSRIVESRICLKATEDTDKVIALIEEILPKIEDISQEPAPVVGVHDFTYGGIIIGVRAWVPGSKYYPIRYQLNNAIVKTLKQQGIALMEFSQTSLALPALNPEELPGSFDQPGDN